MIRNAARLGRPVSLAALEEMGANGSDRDLADYLAFEKKQVALAENFEALSRKEIYQIMVGGRKEEYPLLLQGVKGAAITAWWPRAVDIIPANGGKGVGVKKVLEFFHLQKAEAIAFGDGSNDIGILRAVGTGVAMGNALPEVKAAAAAVCGTVREDGIYTYCSGHRLL